MTHIFYFLLYIDIIQRVQFPKLIKQLVNIFGISQTLFLDLLHWTHVRKRRQKSAHHRRGLAKTKIVKVYHTMGHLELVHFVKVKGH